jgi:hypothetical protein
MTTPMGPKTISIVEQSLWFPKWQSHFGLLCQMFRLSLIGKYTFLYRQELVRFLTAASVQEALLFTETARHNFD